MRKVVFNVFICIYVVITILVTYILLSYNEHNVAEFNKFYLISDKSDLVVINKDDNINIGDNVYYYDNKNIVNSSIVSDISIDIYKLDNGITIGKDDILGNMNNSRKYSSLGSVYHVLTSKWGYLFIIVFPMLIAFVYEIYEIVKEIKKK